MSKLTGTSSGLSFSTPLVSVPSRSSSSSSSSSSDYDYEDEEGSGSGSDIDKEQRFKNYLSRGVDTVKGWVGIQPDFNIGSKREQIRASNKEILERNREAARIALGDKYTQLKRNPYVGYRPQETEDLVDLIGRRNVGLKFNPVLNSAQAAREFIEDRIEKARRDDDQRALTYWSRWGVKELDLDRDKSTVNNVVVYSDKDFNRIKSVDGYSIVPRTKKESLRARYIAFPTKEARAEAMNSLDKKYLKAYFRKHPDPAVWSKFPYEDFVQDYSTNVSAFNQVKHEIKASYLDNDAGGVGLTMYSKDKNPDGVLTLTHYMTLLQKLSSFVMNMLYVVFFEVKPDYDLYADPYKLKNKTRMKQLQDMLQEPYGKYTDKLINYLRLDVTPEENATLCEAFVQGAARSALFVAYNSEGSNLSVAEKILNDICKKARDPNLITWDKVPDENSLAGVVYTNVRDKGKDKQQEKAAERALNQQKSNPQFLAKSRLPMSKDFSGFPRKRRAQGGDYTRAVFGTPRQIFGDDVVRPQTSTVLRTPAQVRRRSGLIKTPDVGSSSGQG
jgi:hypothetical protein